jgi:4-amino-4-deoxy-L-arabinose transferase-like glycosyltransferase
VEEEKTRRSLLLECFAFFLFALILRTAYLLAMTRVLDSADAIHYIEAAKHFTSGDFLGFDAKIPILYPLLAAAFHYVARDYEFACVLTSLFASSLLVAPIFALSRDLHGLRVARISALIICVWPWLIDYATRIGPDALGCTLWFTSIWTLSRALHRGGWWIFAAQLSFFGLHLTRAEGTVLLCAAIVIAIPLYLKDGSRSLKRLIPFVAGCTILLGLYAAYMRAVTGDATVNYRVHFILRDFQFRKFAITALRSFSDVLPVMTGPVMLLFAGKGLFHIEPKDASGVFPRDARLEFFVLLFAGAQWFISLFVLSAEPRYLMSVTTALGLWSARGVVLVSEDLKRQKYGKLFRWAPIGVVLLMMSIGVAASIAAQFTNGQPQQPVEYKKVGLWMKENLQPGLVFTRKPQVGYYADMPTTGPNKEDSMEQAIERARVGGARYMVVDERYSVKITPGLAPLLNPEMAPPGLKHLKTFDLYPASRVVVYEVLNKTAARE